MFQLVVGIDTCAHYTRTIYRNATMGLINSHHFGQIQIAPRLGFSMEAIVMPQSEGAFA